MFKKFESGIKLNKRIFEEEHDILKRDFNPSLKSVSILLRDFEIFSLKYVTIFDRKIHTIDMLLFLFLLGPIQKICLKIGLN